MASNRLMTVDEAAREIGGPMLAAFRKIMPEVKEDARKAFASGKKVYREVVMGIAIVITPENIDGI